MQPGLQIGFLWSDSDVIELSIEVSNGEFAGTARAYVDYSALADNAAALAGFPSNPSDKRTIKLGTLDPAFAGGGIELVLSCRDPAGHATTEIHLSNDGNTPWFGAPRQQVHIFASIEAGAIDEFIVSLRKLDAHREGSALLRFTLPGS